VRERGHAYSDRESMQAVIAAAPCLQLTKKCYNSQTKNIKLNSDFTIKYISINPSKLDLTWIYLDKVTSGSPQ
jgi:hypothetical protein